jgi:hypothetical protein
MDGRKYLKYWLIYFSSRPVKSASTYDKKAYKTFYATAAVEAFTTNLS